MCLRERFDLTMETVEMELTAAAIQKRWLRPGFEGFGIVDGVSLVAGLCSSCASSLTSTRKGRASRYVNSVESFFSSSLSHSVVFDSAIGR